MKSQYLKIGIFIAILGIAGIILSQTINFTKKEYHPKREFMGVDMGGDYYTDEPNPELKNVVLYGGIALLIIGAGVAVFMPSGHNK